MGEGHDWLVFFCEQDCAGEFGTLGLEFAVQAAVEFVGVAVAWFRTVECSDYLLLLL